MNNLGIKSKDVKYKKQISDSIQGELIDLYGSSGCKSTMQTMTKVSGKTGKESLQILNYFRIWLKGFLENHQNQKSQDQSK
jgi:hypothetical protein